MIWKRNGMLGGQYLSVDGRYWLIHARHYDADCTAGWFILVCTPGGESRRFDFAATLKEAKQVAERHSAAAVPPRPLWPEIVGFVDRMEMHEQTADS